MTKKKKLAVIGASYLQLPLVKKAKEMGIEVHCFAWAEGAVCKDFADFFYPISIIEKEEILKQCKVIGIDGITTIASDTATLAVNYVASRMGLVCNSDDYSAIRTNKYLMRRCFNENGIPSPKFTLANEANNYTIKGFTFPLIVKPTDRSGSRGVEKIDDPCQLDKAIQRAIKESFSKEAIIEEFVTGKEISVETISYEGKHYVLQLTDKVTTGAPYFVELEHHQPSTLPQDLQNTIRTLVPKALNALHIRYGASHSELKITENNDIKFIEIGARMGGDFIGSNLVQLSTGYDFLKGTILCAMGSFEEPKITTRCYSGVYFLSEETKNLLPTIKDSGKFPEIVEAKVTNSQLQKIECSGDRSGYFIYQSKIKKYETIKHR